MTKTQLVRKLANDTDISRKQVEEILAVLVETLRKNAKKGKLSEDSRSRGLAHASDEGAHALLSSNK